MHQGNGNLKGVDKTKNRITKNINRGNDVREGNGRRRPTTKLK